MLEYKLWPYDGTFTEEISRLKSFLRSHDCIVFNCYLQKQTDVSKESHFKLSLENEESIVRHHLSRNPVSANENRSIVVIYWHTKAHNGVKTLFLQSTLKYIYKEINNKLKNCLTRGSLWMYKCILRMKALYRVFQKSCLLF